jgi:hypothetical protein
MGAVTSIYSHLLIKFCFRDGDILQQNRPPDGYATSFRGSMEIPMYAPCGRHQAGPVRRDIIRTSYKRSSVPGLPSTLYWVWRLFIINTGGRKGAGFGSKIVCRKPVLSNHRTRLTRTVYAGRERGVSCIDQGTRNAAVQGICFCRNELTE